MGCFRRGRAHGGQCRPAGCHVPGLPPRGAPYPTGGNVPRGTEELWRLHQGGDDGGAVGAAEDVCHTEHYARAVAHSQQLIVRYYTKWNSGLDGPPREE